MRRELKLPSKNGITNTADLHNGLYVIQVVLQSILRSFPFLFVFLSLESMLDNEKEKYFFGS